jgi:hypothetical protein
LKGLQGRQQLLAAERAEGIAALKFGDVMGHSGSLVKLTAILTVGRKRPSAYGKPWPMG